MTDSLVKYATTFESTNNLPMSIEIGHGENADLVASFKDGGVDVDLTGYTARAIYQPKSKWGTDDWYECPCEIVDNTVTAHWGNTYDNGDNAVKLFMHLVKDGKLAYPAIYQISLFSTPGFSPSAIEPIPETIDFSQYTLLNAPWVETDDYSSDITLIRSNLETLANNIPYTYRTIVVSQRPDVSIDVNAKNREIVGVVCNAETTPSGIGIIPPVPVQGQVIEFIVDIDNKTANSIHTVISFNSNWNIALEEGEVFSPYNFAEAGKITRYIFKQVGCPGATKPQLFLSRKILFKAL